MSSPHESFWSWNVLSLARRKATRIGLTTRMLLRKVRRRHQSPYYVLFVATLLLLCLAPFALLHTSKQAPKLRHIAPLSVPRFNDSHIQTFYAPKFDGETRGIVLSVHNNKAALAVGLIRELRRLGNELPIQMYHCFSGELYEDTQRILLEADLLNRSEIIDLCELLLKNEMFNSYWTALDYQSYLLKVVAFLHTPFTQVLLIDVDAIFMQNPDILWEMQQVQDTGTLFFYDRQIDFKVFFNTPMATDSKQTLLHYLFEHFPYESFGLGRPHLNDMLLKSKAWQGLTAHEQDSSVVVFDKARIHPVVLQIMWHLVHHIRMDYIYKPGLSWGDKEYFWLAFALSGAPYAFSPYAAADISLPGDIKLHPQTLCGNLAHYLPSKTHPNPPLLYINGNDILSPYFNQDNSKLISPNATWSEKERFLISRIPEYITPRRMDRQYESNRTGYNEACLINQGSAFTAGEFDGISNELSPGTWMNPHRGFFGNYDIDVLSMALQREGLTLSYFDTRKAMEELVIDNAEGLICNVPQSSWLGLRQSRHWFTIRQVNGTYYNLNSKLSSPSAFSDVTSVRAYLAESVEMHPSTTILIVTKN
ncbi:hypothetical protein THRCLA_08241 [Thraustotheca clavata]|uniref:ubiquitinyl hydrolase 1 n=1 Tax=Thraustotheca clavata TaxID=74557 RepID=A0A1V9Z872_9STRA|nr:hypothetical protein THRCLA_08241 [Thraustotheca clavata]